MIFERYILRNYLGPFFFSIAVITFVFIMDFILRYIDLFLGKGVKFHIVMQAFTLSLGHMFALIIPMAVLPATLMTYGTLAGGCYRRNRTLSTDSKPPKLLLHGAVDETPQHRDDDDDGNHQCGHDDGERH